MLLHREKIEAKVMEIIKNTAMIGPDDPYFVVTVNQITDLIDEVIRASKENS